MDRITKRIEFKKSVQPQVAILNKQNADMAFEELCTLRPRVLPLSHEASLRLLNEKPNCLKEQHCGYWGEKIFHNLLTGVAWPSHKLGNKPFKVAKVSQKPLNLNRHKVPYCITIHVLSGIAVVTCFEGQNRSTHHISTECAIVVGGGIDLEIISSTKQGAEILLLEFGSEFADDDVVEIYAE